MLPAKLDLDINFTVRTYMYRTRRGGGGLARFLVTIKQLRGSQGWKLTLARGELNSVRASGSSNLTSPVGEWEFYGDLSIIS